jgi:hypothetical protein
MMDQNQLPVKAQTTTVIGYFNPNPWPVYIEISDLNLKCTLPSGKYVIDRVTGKYINDPVLEAYVQPKGLSKTVGAIPVPIFYIQRMVSPERPTQSVTEAAGFMRNPNGEVVPHYAPQAPQAQVPVNRIPHMGMTMERARALGYVGKPRLVPEDYGTTDSTGAAPTSNLPSMKYSLESPPKLRTATAMTPEQMQADASLTPQQAAQRAALQQNISRAASQVVENFNPAAVRPNMATTPGIILDQTGAPAQAPHRLLPNVEGAMEVLSDDTEGTLQPLGEGESMPEPTLDPPIVPGSEGGKRFVCAADGKSFRYRSQLDSHVHRKFPAMADDLMAAYPAE